MKKRKSKLLILIIISTIAILVIIASLIINNNKNEEKSNNVSINELESIKEVLEYMQCTYKKEEKSKEEGYDLDVYLEFRYSLNEEKDYVEIFFEKLINNISYVAEYKSLRLIDEKNNILVEIMSDTENKYIKQVKINGIEDYFRKEKQKKDFENYEKRKNTEFIAEAKQLVEALKNNWVVSSIDFGTKEATLDKYDIYFEEGIKVKTVQNRVSEIIFTKKYEYSVVNGIKVGQSFDEIIKTLGEPEAGSKNSYTIGYYGSEYVVFFTNDEIAIYRLDSNYKTDEFENMVEEYIQTDDEKKLMNKLTNLYRDYSKYEYDKTYFEIIYMEKGFSISYNKTEFDGITFYLNYPGKVYDGKTVEELILSKAELPSRIRIQTDIQEDIFYVQETSRMLMRDSYEHAIMDEEEVGKENISNKFIMVNTKEKKNGSSNIKIISKDGEYPDNEFYEYMEINSWLWIDDNSAFYSIKKQGIYIYNAETIWYGRVLEGEDEYNLKDYKDNILTYDDKKIKINY